MVEWCEPKLEQVRTHIYLRLSFSVTAFCTGAKHFYGFAGDVKRLVHKLLGLIFPFITKLPLTLSASIHPLTVLSRIHPLIGTKKDIHNPLIGDNGDALNYMHEVIINLLNVVRLITAKFYLLQHARVHLHF